MQIYNTTSINRINYYTPVQIKRNTVQTSPASHGNVNFCGLKKFVEYLLVENSLSKFKNYTIEEYKSLSEFRKKILRNTYNRSLHEKLSYTEEFHEKFCDQLKNGLDREYGENNYKVIIIGRSLSSIGKVLGYKIGEENVKNIPMSDAQRYLDNKLLKILKSQGHIKSFRKYLKSIGLNKEEIEKSKKKYIITDYCISGYSLAGAANLLTRQDVLGKKNIIPKNVMDFISDKTMADEAERIFFRGALKITALVKQTSNINNLSDSIVHIQEEKLPYKLLWFKLLDNEMFKRKDLNKKNFSLSFLKLKKLQQRFSKQQ